MTDRANLANRRAGYLRSIPYYADQVADLQQAGVVGIRQITAALNSLGMNPHNRPWSPSAVYRLVVEGAALGLNDPPRTRSTAGSQRPYVHRVRGTKLSSKAIEALSRTASTAEGPTA